MTSTQIDYNNLSGELLWSFGCASCRSLCGHAPNVSSPHPISVSDQYAPSTARFFSCEQKTLNTQHVTDFGIHDDKEQNPCTSVQCENISDSWCIVCVFLFVVAGWYRVGDQRTGLDPVQRPDAPLGHRRGDCDSATLFWILSHDSFDSAVSCELWDSNTNTHTHSVLQSENQSSFLSLVFTFTYTFRQTAHSSHLVCVCRIMLICCVQYFQNNVPADDVISVFQVQSSYF